MQENNQLNVIVRPAIDEGKLIKEKENKSQENTLINPFIVTGSQKPKKDLFAISYHRDEQKENEIIQRKKIDLSPIPLSLRKYQTLLPKENSTKEKNQKETRDNSDFDIDIMSESSGFNKIQKEKEFDINNLKINLGKPKNENEDEIDEINLSNDDSEENKENSLSKNSIIDLTEGQDEENLNEINEELSEKEKEKDKDFTPGEKKKKKIQKSRFLRGHCPFNFFEKEKCKNIDFKKINIRTYISEISAQWKVMTDEEKQPYVKLSEEFKKKFLANNNIDEEDLPKLSIKKRKRKKKNINKNTNLNVGYKNIKKEGENIINNNNSLDNFSIYTTNKYVKKKMNNMNNINNNNINDKNNLENKFTENESSSGVQQTVEKSENEKKENNNDININIFNDICDKFKALKCISESEINIYMKTILLPFVLKSLEFLNGIN